MRLCIGTVQCMSLAVLVAGRLRSALAACIAKRCPPLLLPTQVGHPRRAAAAGGGGRARALMAAACAVAAQQCQETQRRGTPCGPEVCPFLVKE